MSFSFCRIGLWQPVHISQSSFSRSRFKLFTLFTCQFKYAIAPLPTVSKHRIPESGSRRIDLIFLILKTPGAAVAGSGTRQPAPSGGEGGSGS